MTSKEHAEGLIRYFEMINKHYPAEKWRLGAETSKEWLRLIDSEAVSEPEVVSLLGITDQNKSKGSGWTDLAMGINRWARAKGFRGIWLVATYSMEDVRKWVAERKNSPEDLEKFRLGLIKYGVRPDEMEQLGF